MRLLRIFISIVLLVQNDVSFSQGLLSPKRNISVSLGLDQLRKKDIGLNFTFYPHEKISLGSSLAIGLSEKYSHEFEESYVKYSIGIQGSFFLDSMIVSGKIFRIKLELSDVVECYGRFFDLDGQNFIRYRQLGTHLLSGYRMKIKKNLYVNSLLGIKKSFLDLEYQEYYFYDSNLDVKVLNPGNIERFILTGELEMEYLF